MAILKEQSKQVAKIEKKRRGIKNDRKKLLENTHKQTKNKQR